MPKYKRIIFSECNKCNKKKHISVIKDGMCARCRTTHKICTKCKQNKVMSDFYKMRQAADGRNYRCRVCIRSIRENHPEYIEQQIKRVKYRKQRLKDVRDFIDGVKISVGCCHCGLRSDIPAVFDFHHIRPEDKEFQIAMAGKKNLDDTVEEMNKCTLLCSNCHRTLHYYQRSDRVKYETMIAEFNYLNVSQTKN